MTVWFVKKPRPTAKVRLFCFPFSGGGASAFRLWADAMPSVEVCAVQPPGRETRLREPAFSHIDPLVAAITEELRAELDRPFAFFGHSLGSFVAFETARALRREGLPLPLHLVLSGCSAPEMHAVARPIHDLPESDLVTALGRYQGTPQEVLRNQEIMALLLPLIRADFAVFETYAARAEPPLDIPITALGGLEDDHASRAQLDAWRAHTTKSFLLRMFPGGHFFIQTSRPEVLAVVQQDLGPHLR